MDLYPAIDIHAGQVVRAPRADLRGATPVAADPVALAQRLAAAGATWIHVVDLDRAFGVGDQLPLLAALVKALAIPVQVSGGVRDAESVASLRDVGVQRVLVDARVATMPRVLAQLADQFAADSVGLALDVDAGGSWGRGWDDARRHRPADLARRAADAGMTLLAVTDVAREGTLAGPDVAGAVALMRETGMDVVVSGGVRSGADLIGIREAGLAGAIVGRALHEGRLTMREALACSSSSSRQPPRPRRCSSIWGSNAPGASPCRSPSCARSRGPASRRCWWIPGAREPRRRRSPSSSTARAP